MEGTFQIPVKMTVIQAHGEIIILEFVKAHAQLDHLLIINHGYA